MSRLSKRMTKNPRPASCSQNSSGQATIWVARPMTSSSGGSSEDPERLVAEPDVADVRELLSHDWSATGAHWASARSPSGMPCGVGTSGVSRRYHSASRADWQPDPAAVIAWR